MGQRDDAGRFSLDGPGTFEGGHDLSHVVAVDDLSVPAEGGELAVNRVHVQHVFSRASLLEMVPVDDAGEIIEPVLGGRGGGLPDLTLADLAVAGHHIGVIRLAVDPAGQCVADPD